MEFGDIMQNFDLSDIKDRLSSVQFPANKDELLGQFKQNDGDSQLHTVFQNLPDRSYEDEDDVASEVAAQQNT